jgi:hypothetical protein
MSIFKRLFGRSAEPSAPAAPSVFRDDDGREFRYERGHRVYLDGGPPPPEPAPAKNSLGKVHGLFDVTKLTELASGRRCLMCGEAMQISGSGFSLKCSAGHEQLAFFAFDNSYCTKSKKVAEALAGRGCRVVKAEDRELWNIFVP